MSIHEKIEDYKSRCAKAELERKLALEAQKKIDEANRIAFEKAERLKAGPLFKALTSLGVYGTLQSIRDEVWKFGTVKQEIFLGGDYDYSPRTGRARALLVATWPRFVPLMFHDHGESTTTEHAHVHEVCHRLEVQAVYSKEGEISIIMKRDVREQLSHPQSVDFRDPNCKQIVDDFLIVDSIERKNDEKYSYGELYFPYDRVKKEDEAELIRQIQRDFKPDEKYADLVNKAWIQNPIASLIYSFKDTRYKF